MTGSLSLPHRLWRCLPQKARREGLAWLAGHMAPACDPTPPPRSTGLAVAGEMDALTGLGEAARCFATAAAALGYGGTPVRLGIGHPRSGQVPPGAALLLAVNAPSLAPMLARGGADFLRGRHVIGSWVWELPTLPPVWAAGARYVHEIWAPSPFVARALSRLLPGRVRLVPYPLALCPPPAPVAPEPLALPPEAVVVLVVLALGSGLERKNPLAAIAAFRQAFGTRADRVLIVKLQGAAAFPRAAALVQAQAGPNIRIIPEDWPRPRLAGLLWRADIVLSLHRAEGFGLVLAEAMLAGKPVVATGWSGNLAFMDADGAGLVAHRLIPVRDAGGHYADLPGALWAEPEIEHAAIWLRRLADHPAQRHHLGRQGQMHARVCLDGAPMQAALAAAGIRPCAMGLDAPAPKVFAEMANP